MSNKENDKLVDMMADALLAFKSVHSQSYDNLFSANSRNKMIQKYNYTEAQRVTVEDLCNLH